MTRRHEFKDGAPPKVGGLYRRIRSLVSLIPVGEVSTYGQVANILGTCGARQVGYSMASLPENSGVPWHRVINAKGEVSPRASGDDGSRQRRLLANEGVLADSRGRIDLRVYGWLGPPPDWFESIDDEADEV